MPAISIITPVFNAARWLPETIASVQNQLFADWEHIFADDGSTDGSIDLIGNASREDPRIRLVRVSQNGGPAKARNRAIAVAQGRYLAFIDADDLWLPHKLSRSISWMNDKSYPFIYHDYRHISHDGSKVGALVVGPSTLTPRTLHTRRGTGVLSVVIDRQKIPGFHFPEAERSLPEDFLAWLWVLRKGYIGHRLPEDLGRYRLSDRSRSSKKTIAAKAVWDLYRKYSRLSLPQCALFWSQYAWRAYWLHLHARPNIETRNSPTALIRDAATY